MKCKLFLLAIPVGLLVLTSGMCHAGTIDDIVNGCYATTKCGSKTARTFVDAYIRMQGISTGAAPGVVAGLLLPGGLKVFGFALGAGGAVLGNDLGGKLAKEINHTDDYMYFADGTCLQCDTHQAGENYECPNGTIVTNGGRAFKCHIGTFLAKDSWQETQIPICSDSPVKTKTDTQVSITFRDTLTNDGKLVTPGVRVYSGAVCMYIEELQSMPDNKDKKQKDNVQRCRQSRQCAQLGASAAECDACCMVGDFAKWNAQTRRCECADATQTFDVAQKKCVSQTNADTDDVTQSPSDTPEKETCRCSALDKDAIIELRKWCTDAMVQLDEILDVHDKCNPDAACPENYNFYINRLKTIKQTICQTQYDANVDASRDVVKNALGNIDKYRTNLDVSVWKTRDGSFNTARLASDATAGVVVGTVGALVTSNIVKKNQISNGMDDIKCTIGDQVVATYGDDFTVGNRN